MEKKGIFIPPARGEYSIRVRLFCVQLYHFIPFSGIAFAEADRHLPRAWLVHRGELMVHPSRGFVSTVYALRGLT